jgi:hypothetical protein
MAKDKVQNKMQDASELSSEQEYESFMASFEEEGVITSVPTLPEGWYPALLTSFTSNYGITAKKGKNTPVQVDGKYPWFMLGALFKTDSALARAIVKRDNDPTIRADGELYGFPGNVQLHERFGIAKDGNGMFWTFVGKLFSQIGMAEEFTDNEGTKGYKLDASIIKAIYGHIPTLYKDLTDKVANGERLHEDDKKNEAKLIPAMLAASQLDKLNQLLQSPDGDTTLQKVVLLVSIKERYNDPSKKDNYARDFRFWSEIIDTLQEDENGTTFTLNIKNNEVVFDLNV